MADKMEFPKTMKEFIKNHSFKDIAEVYTNGAELVPVFRVEQALEHYEAEIRAKAIDEFFNELCKASESVRPVGWTSRYNVVLIERAMEIAEEMKAGGINE